MVKVFLVDDEIVIREGIRNSFPWEESGYTLVGSPDGEIALPMIRDANPDILITDIRCPSWHGGAVPRGQAPDAVDRRGDPVGIRRFHLRAPGHLPGREGIPAQARDRPGAQGGARPHLRAPHRGAPRPRGHGPHAPPTALRQSVCEGKAALLPLYRRTHGGRRRRRHDRADAHAGHQPGRQVLRGDRHGVFLRGRVPLGAARRALRPGRGQRRHRAGVRRQAGRPRAGAGRQRGRHRGPLPIPLPARPSTSWSAPAARASCWPSARSSAALRISGSPCARPATRAT